MDFIKSSPASHTVKDNGDIVFADKTTIKKFVPDVDKIINRSIVFYGPSKTGKSYGIMHLLEILATKVEKALVICPTDTSNYRKVIPSIYISPEISSQSIDLKTKKTAKSYQVDNMQSYLDNLISIQHKHTEVYKKTSNIDTLWEIYKHIRDNSYKSAFDDLISRITTDHKRSLEKLKKNTSFTSDQLQAYKEDMINIYNKNVLKLLQDYIITNKHNIRSSLSSEHADLIKYIGINPNLVLILDDMGADLPTFSKIPDFKKLFFQGRHLSVTLIISCQSDKSLTTELRANAFITICTEIKTAKTMLGRESSQIDKETKGALLKIAPVVFGIEHVKLLYHRDEDAYFTYKAEPSIPYRFKVGSKAYWELAEKSETKSSELASDLFRAL